jgi:hypothetical protein
VTDALSQVKTFSYNDDDTMSGVAYTASVNSTSNISYTYDATYPRLTSVANGYGTLSYSYNAYITNPCGSATTGAGQVSQITNSALGSSAITYTYDALGRATNRSINGSVNSSSWTFDAMGRITGLTNPLGSFVYHYVDDATALGAGNDKGTTRLSSINYPNGQVSNFGASLF